MPTTVDIQLQVVNGDPATSGGNINITTSTISAAVAVEDGQVSLSSVATGDVLTINGLDYNYEYLGSHLVRDDPDQPAAYIRIVGPLPSGATLDIGDTFAIDLTGEPGDPDYPNLQNGNTQGTVASLDTTTEIQFPGFICFARGTHIRTPQGDLAIESLSVGDFVETLDHGPKQIRAIFKKVLKFDRDDPRHKPIEFKAGSLGTGLPSKTLNVSPQHRVLVKIKDEDCLVAAKGLLHFRGVRQKEGCKSVEYFHLVFDAHEVIYSEGAPTESFFPGAVSLSILDNDQRAELVEIFPEIFKSREKREASPARKVLRPGQTRQLLPRNFGEKPCPDREHAL